MILSNICPSVCRDMTASYQLGEALKNLSTQKSGRKYLQFMN